jgi:hypothetical protein
MQRLPLANREEELAFFAGMVAGTSDERILLLEAGGGMGKTTLMAEFVRHCRAGQVPCVPVDLKGDLGLDEVLARLCDELGWEGFPTLTARVEELGRGGRQAAEMARFEHIHREEYPLAAIDKLMIDAFAVDDLRRFCFYSPALNPVLEKVANDASLQELVMAVIEFCQQQIRLSHLLGEIRAHNFEQYKRHYAQIYGVEAGVPAPGEPAQITGAGPGRAGIRDALRAADEGDRAARRGALTRGLFEDLANREGRLVILFDTCEQAGPQVGAWLAEVFLAHAQRAENLVVVIAGREVPEVRLEWEACCQHHLLKDLRDPGLWQAYAEQIGAAIPSAEWIEAFCDLFDGHPLQMMQALARYMPGGGGQ